MRAIIFSLFMCVMMSAQTVTRTGMAEYEGHLLHWAERDGYAITDGDIIIGRAADLEAKPSKAKARGAISVATPARLWPNGTIPYTIDAGFPNPQRVMDAITDWQAKTVIRFVARTTETDYVLIKAASSGCFSNVGRVGGQQTVNLDATCDTASTIHELGHSAGLWHEHNRQDRDFYVKVDYSSINKASYGLFAPQVNDGADLGYYDYGSIMHYPPVAAPATASPNISSIPPGIPVGEATALSAGDASAINRMYGGDLSMTTVTSNPEGLLMLVDGQAVLSPSKFAWAAGSTHTIDVAQDVQASSSQYYRFRFARWSDNGPQRHVITVNPQETTWYSANFAVEYRLLAGAVSGGKVTADPYSADGWYKIGQPLTLQAVPDTGYKFVNWEGFGLLLTLGNSNNPYRLPQLGYGYYYVANFTQGAVTRIDTTAVGAKVQVDGTTYALPSQFAWSPASVHNLSVSTPQVPFSSADTLGFNSWSVGGGGLTAAVTATDSDQTVTANFTRNVQLALTVVGEGGGVQVGPGATNLIYPQGTTVTLRPVALTPGWVFQGWSGDATGATTPLIVPMQSQTLITASFALPGQLLTRAVVNAASFAFPATVAPGELVSIFGVNLGPDEPAGAALGSDGRLITEANGTKVTFDGIAAPISYVSAGQLNVIVPYAVAGKDSVEVAVTSPGRTVNNVTLGVRTASPSVFTANSSGKGNCACLNQNGSANSALNPAVRGSVVVLYATGEGQTVPAGVDGQIAGATLPKPVLPVSVRIAGRLAIVEYAGAAPGLAAGVMQINARIPDNLPAGDLPVQVLVGDNASIDSVTVAVQ